MRDLGLTRTEEPFANLLTQGMVLNEIYLPQAVLRPHRLLQPGRRGRAGWTRRARASARCCVPTASRSRAAASARCRSRRTTASIRSRWSRQYGADTARLFMMFAAPPEQSLEWSRRGRRRLVPLHEAAVEGGAPARAASAAARHARQGGAVDDGQRDMRRQVHETLVKVTNDIGTRRTFNTAIAAVMELMNALARFEDRSAQGRAVAQEALEIVVLGLSPVVPHACHALWRELGHSKRRHRRALAAARSGRAGARRDRGRRAGERQAARPRHGRRRAPSEATSARSGAGRRGTCRSSSTASRSASSSTCPASSPTWSSDACAATATTAAGRRGRFRRDPEDRHEPWTASASPQRSASTSASDVSVPDRSGKPSRAMDRSASLHGRVHGVFSGATRNRPRRSVVLHHGFAWHCWPGRRCCSPVADFTCRAPARCREGLSKRLRRHGRPADALRSGAAPSRSSAPGRR